ncbi:hypothetical protein NRIC_16830 [Enterococcus florum]|uniref:Uncharacterized protein n=1 Tax=Enterococcus florum TaxID=2480627 RepID=A0A4P5PDW9_9ENTE|nr:hypothetical protein [Enterococcus florum]GCF93792.1 hypothetical protein NRIC_16830 [Enterococcus florum]
MAVKPLEQRQLYTMKKERLEKRFFDFYEETKDAAYLIQCAVAVLVRNALCAADFSYLAKELIRELFFANEDVDSVRDYCVYFRDYFTSDEWTAVIGRLFESNDAFLAATKQTRLQIEHLRAGMISGSRPVSDKAGLVSVFEDASGKKHGWNLSNVDPSLKLQEVYDLLHILTSLTIFQKDGTRRFAKVIKANFYLVKSSFDVRNEDDLVETYENPVDLQPMEIDGEEVPPDSSAAKAAVSTKNTTSSKASGKEKSSDISEHERQKREEMKRRMFPRDFSTKPKNKEEREKERLLRKLNKKKRKKKKRK